MDRTLRKLPRTTAVIWTVATASIVAYSAGACSSSTTPAGPGDDADAGTPPGRSGASASGGLGSPASGSTSGIAGASASGASATATATGTSGGAGSASGGAETGLSSGVVGTTGFAGAAGANSGGGGSGDAQGGASGSEGGGSPEIVGWTAPPPAFCPAGPFGNPIPAGATVSRVAGIPPADTFNVNETAFGIIEGPVWIGEAIYMSEFGALVEPPPSRILKLTEAGVVSVAISDSGSNGLAVDKTGVLYGAVHKDGSITRFDLTAGTGTPITNGYMGSRFDSPNDLAIRSDGYIYFSDPDFQAPTPAPQAQTRIYCVAPGTNAVSVIDATVSEPNGVTLSLDESMLYVAAPSGLRGYPMRADGSAGPSTFFAQNVNGDGMVIDCAGNLYVAEINTTTVAVFSPAGAPLGSLSVPGVQAVSNVAFGGDDRKTLYITTLGPAGEYELFKVALAIPGLPY